MRVAVSIVLAALAVAACSSPNAMVTAEASPSPSHSAASGSPPVADLVGEWVGTHDCLAIVEALRAAGFDDAVVLDAVLGNELVPGAASSEDLADPLHPCIDAVPREHSHFFTADGRFGSRDFRGQQVDDDTYEIAAPESVVIGAMTFEYTIVGDSLVLDPIIPSGCLTDDCGWAIMVGMAGTPLQRR